MTRVVMRPDGLFYDKDWISQPFEIIRKISGEYLSFDNMLVPIDHYWQGFQTYYIRDKLVILGFKMTQNQDLRDKFFVYVEEEARKLRPKRK